MEQNGNEQLNIEAVSPPTGDGVAVAEQPKKKINKFWDILLWVLIAVLAVAVMVRAFVYTNVTVSGESMSSTYSDGEVVHVNKLTKLKRGDVVVFYKYDVDSKFKALFASGADVQSGGKYEKLIKRVVAVEGDSIWVEATDGGYKLVVKTADGAEIYEDYYKKGKAALNADNFVLPNTVQGLGQLSGHTKDNPLVIEAGHFFAMGDNRGNSEDSRGNLGQVPLDRLYGVVTNK